MHTKTLEMSPDKHKNKNNNNNHNSNNVVSKAADSSSGGFTGSTQTHQACASCKYQRRKCAANCPLAPYFPAEMQKDFLNAHRLFGVRKIMKALEVVEPFEREIAINSMIFQANVRATDPVGGCYRMIKELQRQIDLAKAELDLVLHQLALCRAQAQAAALEHNNTNIANPNLNPNPNVVATTIRGNGVSGVNVDYSLGVYDPIQSISQAECSRPLRHVSFQAQPSSCFGQDNQYLNDGDECYAIRSDVQEDGPLCFSQMHGKQDFVGDSEDIKPLLRMLDDKQVVPFDTKETKESMNSSEKVVPQKFYMDLDQPEQENDLKGAASLFSLTNGDHAAGCPVNPAST